MRRILSFKQAEHTWGHIPKLGEKVTYDGREYRVEHIGAFTLTLVD